MTKEWLEEIQDLLTRAAMGECLTGNPMVEAVLNMIAQLLGEGDRDD